MTEAKGGKLVFLVQPDQDPTPCGACKHCQPRYGRADLAMCAALASYCSTVRSYKHARCPSFERREEIGVLRRLWRWLW